MKASGETDFPCMSGTRVGQGRGYVRLGKVSRIDYAQWIDGIARGRSYVSDGYAHALDFAVNGKSSGDELALAAAGTVTVKTVVAFSPETPLESPYGGLIPVGGRRHVGDTVIKRETQSPDPIYQRGKRLVEVIVNGRAVASREVPADGRQHALEFAVPIERSSWIAIRQFPELHTNPVYASSPANRSGRRAPARSGRSRASISSGACARGASPSTSAPRRRRLTKRRGLTTGASPRRRLRTS